MDVILHLGAHRTATTSFQHYLRANSATLEARGIGYWGPLRTRGGLLCGVIPVAGTVSAEQQFVLARGRIAIQAQAAKLRGVQYLIVSDENMIGTPRLNMRMRSLYCGVGERMARFHAAFDGRVTRAVLSIRSPERWWASAIAALIPKGQTIPNERQLQSIVESQRSWRDVVTDIACAMPGVDLEVAPYETFAGRPELKLQQLTEPMDNPPNKEARIWINNAPDLAALRELTKGRDDAHRLPSGEGRWTPFTEEQSAVLRERYSDDLFWLASGADGLAKLVTQDTSIEGGINPPNELTKRGRRNDIEKGHLARSG